MGKEHRILGVDPGTLVTGYGIIEPNGSRLQAVDYGCIRPPRNFSLHDRFWILFTSLQAVIEEHRPHVAVFETQYVHKNVQSALTLGTARGVILAAARQKGLQLAEYTPKESKRAVTGNGNAAKSQVQKMVQQLLSLREMPQPADAADALALAICYIHGVKR